MNSLSRRTFLKLSAAAAGTVVLHQQFGLAQPATTSVVADDMRLAAQQVLESLGDARTNAQFAFNDQERFDWHWNFAHRRDGIALNQMTETQREAVLNLVAAGTSPAGFQKALDIMFLQAVLGNDPGRFYLALFGDPNDRAWGWRFEGHHLSVNVTVVDGRVSMTPLFLGAQPTTVARGERQGLQAMKYEEESARALMLSLGEAAIFNARALGNHLTGRDTQVQPLEPVGVPVNTFNADQRGYLETVLGEYLGVMPAPVATEYRGRLEQAGVDNITFGWAGAQVPLQAHYYRMQNASFLLEFDNSRNSATHIHSVWRDFEHDFGLSWV
ncbi:MAG: DUF3500 domain-containing protein [Deinococcota bacterium]